MIFLTSKTDKTSIVNTENSLKIQTSDMSEISNNLMFIVKITEVIENLFSKTLA